MNRTTRRPMPPARTQKLPAARFGSGAALNPLPPFVAGTPHKEAQIIETPDAGGSASVDVSSVETPGPSARESSARRADSEASFPLDAFIVPEDARRVPAGVGAVEAARPAAAGDADDRAFQELIDRLAALAHRLQREGPSALSEAFAQGERFEALVAALVWAFHRSRDDVPPIG